MTLFNIYINLYLLIALGIIAGVPVYFLIFKGIKWLLVGIDTDLDVIDDPINDFTFFLNSSAQATAIIKACCQALWPIYLAILVVLAIVAIVVVILKNLAKIWLKIIKFAWHD